MSILVYHEMNGIEFDLGEKNAQVVGRTIMTHDGSFIQLQLKGCNADQTRTDNVKNKLRVFFFTDYKYEPAAFTQPDERIW